MTEFKKGDKVTHCDEYFSGTFTVLAQYGRDVTVDDVEGRRRYFSATNLTKVEEPKPAVKVGDRVRLVHEGVVTGTSGTGISRSLQINGSARLLGKGETVEILERAPEPVKAGTVAASADAVYVQLPDGQVRATYVDEASKGFSQILSGPVTVWGKVIYEPASS